MYDDLIRDDQTYDDLKYDDIIYDDLMYSGWVSTMVLIVHQPRVPTNRPTGQ